MEKLNYKKELVEPFALNTIACSYDKSYKYYLWNKSEDNSDFVSPNGETSLEVSVVIPLNIQRAVVFESSKKANISYVKDAEIGENGLLKKFYGGSIEELKQLIIERVYEKQDKAKNRNKKYTTYELCLCIDDGGLFEYEREMFFLLNHKTIFSKIFLITSSRFFVLENETIVSYKRKIMD